MDRNKLHDDFCNAKTRSGNECKHPAGWGTDHVGKGRCKNHAGCSTGPSPEAAKDNQNARKHGLFSKCLNEHGKEVYNAAKDASGEELQRDSAEFLIAQIAQAFETNEKIEKAKNQVEEAILAMIEQETINPKYGYSLINRMRQPDIGTLGKALGPLKGLLDKKKEEEAGDEQASLTINIGKPSTRMDSE